MARLVRKPPFLNSSKGLLKLSHESYNPTTSVRVAHKPTTTLQQLLTNVKDKGEASDGEGAVYEIKCCDCQVTYIGESGIRLTNERLEMVIQTTELNRTLLNALRTTNNESLWKAGLLT